jgi:hypothetical protein
LLVYLLRFGRFCVSLAAILIAFVIAVPACAMPSARKSPQVPCKRTPDDKAVYIAVLRDSGTWKSRLDPDSIRAYTLTETNSSWSLGPLSASAQILLNQSNTETRADFASKNKSSCSIGGFRKGDIDKTAQAEGNWSGDIRLSRIGFNSTRDEALVYTESVCGSLCGSGDIFLLRKERDHWEVVAQRNLWVS